MTVKEWLCVIAWTAFLVALGYLGTEAKITRIRELESENARLRILVHLVEKE